MNQHSSRSHCLVFVNINGVNIETEERTFGKLVLIDLAGSERVKKSEAEGSRLKEAQHINLSLSNLGNVISALKNKQQHIPYRNSKLTYLLQDCLGGHSKCLMFSCVSPANTNHSETFCSLEFATRARSVQLGKAERKVKSGDGTRAKQEVSKLQDEVKAAKDHSESMREKLKELKDKSKSTNAEVKAISAQLEAKEAELDKLERSIEMRIEKAVAAAEKKAAAAIARAEKTAAAAVAAAEKSATAASKRRSVEAPTASQESPTKKAKTSVEVKGDTEEFPDFMPQQSSSGRSIRTPRSILRNSISNLRISSASRSGSRSSTSSKTGESPSLMSRAKKLASMFEQEAASMGVSSAGEADDDENFNSMNIKKKTRTGSKGTPLRSPVVRKHSNAKATPLRKSPRLAADSKSVDDDDDDAGNKRVRFGASQTRLLPPQQATSGTTPNPRRVKNPARASKGLGAAKRSVRAAKSSSKPGWNR